MGKDRLRDRFGLGRLRGWAGKAFAATCRKAGFETEGQRIERETARFTALREAMGEPGRYIDAGFEERRAILERSRPFIAESLTRDHNLENVTGRMDSALGELARDSLIFPCEPAMMLLNDPDSDPALTAFAQTYFAAYPERAEKLMHQAWLWSRGQIPHDRFFFELYEDRIVDGELRRFKKPGGPDHWSRRGNVSNIVVAATTASTLLRAHSSERMRTDAIHICGEAYDSGDPLALVAATYLRLDIARTDAVRAYNFRENLDPYLHHDNEDVRAAAEKVEPLLAEVIRGFEAEIDRASGWGQDPDPSPE